MMYSSVWLFTHVVFFFSTSKTVLADIPVHCVQPEVIGLWRFHVGTYHGKDGPDGQCGYSSPDKPDGHHELTPPNAPKNPAKGNYFLTDKFKEEFTVQVLLKDWTSRVVAVDAAGKQHFPDDVENMAGGEWTMIYDEGFHINVGDSKEGQHSFLAFSKYMIAEKEYAGSTDNFANKKHSYCQETLLGWYKQVDPATGLVKRQQCWWGERIQTLHEALASLPPALTSAIPPVLPLPLGNSSAANRPAKDQSPSPPRAWLRGDGSPAHDGSMAVPFLSHASANARLMRRGLQLLLALSVGLGMVATYQFVAKRKDGKEQEHGFSYWHVVAMVCGVFALGMTGALWFSPGAVESAHPLENLAVAAATPILKNDAPLRGSADGNHDTSAKRKINITEAAYRQHASLQEAVRNGTAVRWQSNPEKFKQWLRERRDKHGMNVHEGSTVDEILDAFAPRRSVSVGDYGFATEQIIGPVRDVAIKEQLEIAKAKGKAASELTTADVKDGWTTSDTNHHKQRTFMMNGQVLEPEGWQTLTDFDWRKVSLKLPGGKSISNFVNAVPDQGGCGSCYAVAATSMITSRLMLKYPELHEKFAASRGADRISVEQQLNCNPYNQGCSGGYPYMVSAWSSFNNLASQDCIEQSSAHNASSGDHWQCDASKLSGEACKEQFRVKNWHYIGGALGRCGLHHLCEDAMREELYKGGPLAVSVEPTSGFGYAEGVFHSVSGTDDDTMLSEVHSKKDMTDCSDTECYAWRKVDHSVLLVGWGEDLSQGKTCQARVHRVEKSEAIPDAGCEKIKNEQDLLAGDKVRVIKESRLKGKLAIVVESHWNGMVRVKMEEEDEKGKDKSFKREELEIVNDKLAFKPGEHVRIVKELRLKGKTAIVTDQDWNGLVKVTMDEDDEKGRDKSFKPSDLEHVETRRLRNFRFIGNEKVEVRIGDKMKCLPGKSLDIEGKNYYNAGDEGTVSKERYTQKSDDIDRFEVKWPRTNLTSTMKCDMWMKNFEFVQEPKIGDEMVTLENASLNVDGKEYYVPGDFGRVTKEKYTTTSDGIDRFEITWYRTGLTSTMKDNVWRTYFRFTGNVAKKLPSLGDEVQSLPGSELTVDGKEYYKAGDRGRVSKENYTTASDGVDRFEVTWFRTGLTSTMKTHMWMKNFFFIGRAKSVPQIGDEMRCLPGHDLKVDGKDYYKAGDEGRVTKETYKTTGDGIERFEVTWYRTGLTSTMKSNLWIKYFKYTGRSKEIPMLGDRVEVLPNIRLEVDGTDYYKPGDQGNVSKETYTTASDNIDRFEVKWDRTGLTSTMKRHVWLKNFRSVHEPKVGDEVECLPGISLTVDGKDFYKEGDLGRVCKDVYTTESDGKQRFEVAWYRTGLISTMIADRWENNFYFTGKQKVVPTMGDEMEALPNISLNTGGKEYYTPGDRGRVCKDNYKTESDGIMRFEVTWYRTGLTSTMKTDMWCKNFRCVSQS